MAWLTILVPHDFSASANHAAAIARDEAKLRNARIVLLHIIDLNELDADAVIVPEDTKVPTSLRDYATSAASAHLADLAERLNKDGVAVTTAIRIGHPVDEILHAAESERADVIIMGTHGRSGLRAMIAGSVAERVVRASPIPVLTVRQPAAAASSS
jgi:nucleotide-binding universal stress UspA family protein